MKELRIISGTFKSRKLLLRNTIKGLRPTCDRVRETVFNWLMLDIVNAFCLDAFSGSGILSFEAISRGARHCLCIEKNKIAAREIENNRNHLGINNIEIVRTDALIYLKNCFDYDIIFIDPPFSKDLIKDTLKIIYGNSNIGMNSLIYIEAPRFLNLKSIMEKKFMILKQSIYGNILLAILVKINRDIKK